MSNIINPYRFAAAGPPPFSNSYSAEFDGSASLDDTRRDAPWNVGTGDFSISMWCNHNSLVEGGAEMISFRGASAYTSGFALYMGTESGGTEAKMYLYVGAASAGWVAVDSFTTYTWHNVIWVREGATFKVYVDGSIVYNGTSGWGQDISGGTGYGLHIGASPYGGGSAFMDGYIDEVAFFDSALSTSDITAIAGGPNDLSGYSPVAWYRFEDDTDMGKDSEASYDLTDNGTTQSSEIPS